MPGGYRPGAGRKRGAAEIRTRRIANQMMAGNEISPLEVMLNVMRELWDHAIALPPGDDRLNGLREAATAAKDAAPYLHPRLSSVSATVRQVTNVHDLSDAELEALARSLGGDVIEGEAEPVPVPLPASKRDLN